MIRDRVRTGVARAKRFGTKSGRPIGRPRLAKAQEAAAEKLLVQGMGILRVARTLKMGTGTVSRISAQLRSGSTGGRALQPAPGSMTALCQKGDIQRRLEV
jgi:DNA invertase Pin-like site-specific DNA recombinase